ncbi:MAG: hypothetical protein AAF497_03195, partial [Planctomycetota bacterium]
MTPNPYSSTGETPRAEATPPQHGVRFAFLIPLIVVLPGAYGGFQLMLPPPPQQGDYMCGLGTLPAMLFGAPIG